MLTPEQIKGRIKNYAKTNNADPRVLLRIYMMERFLERVSNSKFADNFIIKGGILVTSMIGVAMRSTMDIDSTIRNLELSEDEMFKIINYLCDIDLNDGIKFKLKELGKIMDDMEYPGVRASIDAFMGKMIIPIKLDISTGDVITPREIEYSYKLMLEDRNIKLWTYNLETILAEKLQTILSRSVLNTRMRDFYDVHTLILIHGDRLNKTIFKEAFIATCKKRNTNLDRVNYIETFEMINKDSILRKLWKSYQDKYLYAKTYIFDDVLLSVNKLLNIVI